MKGKGERERFAQMNEEFQRIARRDKKALLNEQCQEIEESNRMRKTRNLFKKTGDNKGTFHARMDMIKNRNSKDLKKQKLRRGGKNTQNYTKKGLNYLDNHNGVVTNLELDIVEYEAKGALGNITINKASGGVGLSAELFKILKHNAIKVLNSICQQI